MAKNDETVIIPERVTAAREALGMSQEILADRVGMSQSGIASIELGESKRPRKAREIARVLKVTESYLFGEDDEAVGQPGPAAPSPNVSFPPKWQQLASDTYTPVLGQSVTGPNGRFVMNGQEVARVFTPPDLLGVDGAYAVRVHGTSMEPAFYANQTVWMNPHMAVRAYDFVVAQILADDGDGYDSYLKQFVSQGRTLKLRQFNPEEGEGEFLEFPSSKVFSVHKIVFAAYT